MRGDKVELTDIEYLPKGGRFSEFTGLMLRGLLFERYLVRYAMQSDTTTNSAEVLKLLREHLDKMAKRYCEDVDEFMTKYLHIISPVLKLMNARYEADGIRFKNGRIKITKARKALRAEIDEILK